FNSGYFLDQHGDIIKASTDNINDLLAASPDFSSQLIREYGSIDQIPHTFFHGLSIFPNWFWAYNYPHNVNEVGTAIQGCIGNYCSQLSPLVFPTPLYEFVAGFLLFLILWLRRKKIQVAGQMFGIYLIFNGLERFFIEKIRVNSTYSIMGFHPTQAELISSMLILGGIYLLFRKKSSMKLS
ncbi:MAG: prolipoprotein diacylglyceryl transferase family protein, partial [Chitinophagaceae bacterium]